jgi:hypothetical protein
LDQVSGPKLFLLQSRDLRLLDTCQVNLPFQAIHFAIERTVATLEILQAHWLHLRSSSAVADVFALKAEEAPLRIDMETTPLTPRVNGRLRLIELICRSELKVTPVVLTQG